MELTQERRQAEAERIVEELNEEIEEIVVCRIMEIGSLDEEGTDGWANDVDGINAIVFDLLKPTGEDFLKEGDRQLEKAAAKVMAGDSIVKKDMYDLVKACSANVVGVRCYGDGRVWIKVKRATTGQEIGERLAKVFGQDIRLDTIHSNSGFVLYTYLIHRNDYTVQFTD